jgi:hypothetical protein
MNPFAPAPNYIGSEMIGTSLNPYQITDRIGAGGMGEVFRARNTRLNRDVAIKMLQKDVLSDTDRLPRADPEAKAPAALSIIHLLRVPLIGFLSLALLSSCGTPPPQLSLPRVEIREVALVRFPGANQGNPGQPGDTDSNSPAHWDGDILYVFNSSRDPWRSSGPAFHHLGNDYRRVEFDRDLEGGRWIECTWKSEDGTLYGWYSTEPKGFCPIRFFRPDEH